jgi:DNA invertase Pin-like site-specific DNA recombinase
MRIGYIRVSSEEQNLDLQLEAMRQAGCDKVYEDKASGVTQDRPGLQLALEVLREGDTLVVWKLDRLGRTVKQLVNFVTWFEENGIHLKSLTDAIDTTTPSGRFFFHIMASLSQMERELMLERTRAGLSAARARGRLGGRKRKMTDQKLLSAKKLLAAGTTPKEVASHLGISVPTLYRWIPGAAAGSLPKPSL